MTLPVNITDLLRFVAALTSNSHKVKFANMQSTTAEAFLPPVLELLVVVLVRIVNLLLRHSRLMRVVTTGYSKVFFKGAGEGPKSCLYAAMVANSQISERDLSSAADNSNLNGRL